MDSNDEDDDDEKSMVIMLKIEFVLLICLQYLPLNRKHHLVLPELLEPVSVIRH